MKKGFIVLAVVLVIGLYILNKVQTAKQLEYSVSLPKNIRLDASNVLFDLPLQIRNVSQGSIRVKSIDTDVLANGNTLGKAILNQPFTIAPATTTTVMIAVSVGYFNLLTAAGSIVSLFRRGKVTLSINGLVYAEGFKVPIDQSFPFDVSQL